MQGIPSIPGYELLVPLGGGPLTSVFTALDNETDAPCAVKLLRPEWENQPTGVKLLRREARAGLAVRHSHLVRYTDAQVFVPPFFLVMELLGGESLRGRMRRDYRLDLATTLWVIRQTAEALAALHSAGFVHGDVKPDNIHLVEDGVAVLIDLGFAHRPGENEELLHAGYVLGTADYLAPELCRPEPQADQSSDVFSLGVTLFETLTGRLPYPPGTLGETFRRHGCDPPADVQRYAGRLPRDLVQLLGRMLSRRPEERPRASTVVRQLIALEIASLGKRRIA
jgi:serine/threonine protein kinase